MNVQLIPLRKNLLLAGLISLTPAVAVADADAEARILKLEQQVDQLLQQLAAQNTQLIQTQEAVKPTQAASQNTVIAKINGRALSFESVNGAFKALIGRQLQAGTAFTMRQPDW